MKKKSSAAQPLLWFALALLTLVLDQITKFGIVRWLPECFDRVSCVKYEVTGFLNFVLVYNPGSAFSFLAQAGGWQRYFLMALAIVASIVISVLLLKRPQEKVFCSALALMMGGALGNGIDRMMYRGVVDFIDFHYQWKYHWYTFNVADIAIVLAVGLLILHEFKKTK